MLGRLCLALLSGRLVSGAVDPSTPLNQVPFIMARDASMGYLGEDRIYENAVNPAEKRIAWSKTQIGTITEQLNCGARAFDVRPHVSVIEGLVMHHGGVIVYHPFKDMMQEMADWAASHPDDLVIAKIVHCDGDTLALTEQCNEQARNALDELGIPYVYEDFCPGAIQGVTLEKAKELGALEGGGSVLAIWGACWESNYNSSRTCRGYEYESAGVSRKYSCWMNRTNPEYAVEGLFEYLDETHAAGPPANGKLWQMQALWQLSESSVLLGIADSSSILTDALYSRVNRFIFENLTVGRWGVQGVNGVNMLELDYVCDQGNNILLALDPDLDIVFSDYPDDVIINSTGVSATILSGESVLFPEVPDDFSPKTFRDDNSIRRLHRLGRFGNTNDIVDFLNSGDEDKEEEYLKSILGMSILLLCLFALWGLVILYFKWSKKVPWLAGEVPKTSAPSTGESSDGGSVEKPLGFADSESFDFVSARDLKRLRRIRLVVLLCGFVILLFSGLLIGIGFADVADTVDAAQKSLPELRDVFEKSQEATDYLLVQMNQTRDAAFAYTDALADNCVPTGENLENLSGVEAVGIELTENLIALNGTLYGDRVLYDQFYGMNESLTDLIDDISSLEDAVNALDHSVLFPLATAFVLLFDVVVTSFMLCVYFALKDKLPKQFNCFNSAFAIWVFLLLLFAVYLISMLALVGATMAADFCIDTPDNQFLRIIGSSAPFDEFLEYYVRGCDSNIKPELIFDVFKLVEAILLRVHGLLNDLSNVDPDTMLCDNTNVVNDALNALLEEYEAYVDILYRLSQEYNCAEINPIYSGFAYNLACVSGFDSLSQTFGFMLGIAICSMAMITLRVSWYRFDDVQYEGDLLLMEEVQSDVENEREQAQDEVSEMASDEIDVDAASVDEEGDTVSTLNGGEIDSTMLTAP